MTKNQQILLDCAKNAATDAEMLVEGLQEGRSMTEMHDLRGTLRVNLEVALTRCWRLQGGGKVAKGRWGCGHKPAACIDCGTDERPHVARNRCGACYARWRKERDEQHERRTRNAERQVGSAAARLQQRRR